MSERKIHFDFSRMEDFEVGVGLLAILAFPMEAEAEDCARAAEALCACQVRVTIAAAEDPQQQEVWRKAFQAYATLDQREERRRLRTLRRRLRDRMLAGRMSLAYFRETLTGEPAMLPPGLKSLSLNELVPYVRETDRVPVGDDHNFEQRVWRKTRPVIHLAAAMQIVLRQHTELPNIEIREGNNYPLERGDLHREVIALAEKLEALVSTNPRFGRKPIDLVQIRKAG